MSFLKQIQQKLNIKTLRYVALSVFIASVFISYPHQTIAAVYQPGQTLNPSCFPTATNCGVVPPLVLSSSTSTVTASAPAFVATSSSPSTFPYASTTAVSVSGGTASTSALTLGSLTGIMRSVNGVVKTALVSMSSDITGILSVLNGGTGTSTAPTYGKVLLGNSSGTYDLVATSSLGIATGGTPGGSSNQIQLNNSGTFGASSSLTFSSNTLSVQGTASSTNLAIANNATVNGVLNVAGNTTLANASTTQLTVSGPAYFNATTTTKGLSAVFANLVAKVVVPENTKATSSAVEQSSSTTKASVSAIAPANNGNTISIDVSNASTASAKTPVQTGTVDKQTNKSLIVDTKANKKDSSKLSATPVKAKNPNTQIKQPTKNISANMSSNSSNNIAQIASSKKITSAMVIKTRAVNIHTVVTEPVFEPKITAVKTDISKVNTTKSVATVKTATSKSTSSKKAVDKAVTLPG